MKDQIHVAGYVRLSREDVKGPGATEEKLEARARMCQELAARHGLALDPADILIERESGGTLNRSEMQRLLEMARSGQITHLVTPYQDRLSRGNKGDIQVIEDALSQGGVTLITTEGVTPFDDDFETRHGLVWDVRGAVARAFARDLVNKRKVSDLERLKRNVRSRGYAPYGYRYVRAVRDGYGRVVTEQSYEVIESEYVILQEIFERILTESLNAIVNDLNARGIPTPATGRTVTGGKWWSRETVKRICQNPFFAGYYAQQTCVRRGRRVWLRPEEYILADSEGDWPHPITLADWQENCQLIRSRRGKKVMRAGLLTGILHCPAGRAMHRDGTECYGCRCARAGEPHPGLHVKCARLDRWAADVVWAVLQALPASALAGSAPPQKRQALKSQYQALLKSIHAERERIQDLMRRGGYYTGLFGKDRYEEACLAARRDLELSEARAETVRAQMESAKPDTRPLKTIQERLRSVGFDAVWEEMDPRSRREVVRLIVSRIDLRPIPAGKRHYKAGQVRLLPWLAEYAIALPPFPKAYASRRPNGD
jgi:DNA invertase Pin-like site-specific DNA recombinase